MANTAPVLSNLGPSDTFLENTINSAPQIIDGSVSLFDAEGNFDGGTLTIAGLLAEDIVSIQNQTPAFGGPIGFSGGIVTYFGTAFGTVTGGMGSPLIVTFDANANNTFITALIQALTYQNTSDTPTLGRSLSVTVTDADGAATTVDFTELAGPANPFVGLLDGVIGNRETAVPFMADLDGDGDLDAVVGTRNTVQYFENTGTALAPVLVERTGAANPLSFVNFSLFGGSASPTLVDLDNDGDLDAVVGNSRAGELNYYENTGTAFAPVFGGITGIDVGLADDPAVADLDGDGDLDALVGNRDGFFHYFLNIGTAANPVYSEQTGAANPMNGVNVGGRSTSFFADLNDDGLMDIVTGARDGTLRFYLNTGTATVPVFTQQIAGANPFDGVSVGQASTPTLGDIDGDGDLDAVIGSRSSTFVRYFENTGTAAAPVFTEQTGAANPFDGVVFGRNPVLADVDGDGDLDAAVGGFDSTIHYFENTGTPSGATYVERTGAANPFDGIIERDARFALADFDGDGDLDALVGDREGALTYFVNVGTATAPVFDTANPFSGRDLGRDVRPTFADLDNDGDFDLVVGNTSGTLRYFENIGTASASAFLERTGAANPLNGISVGRASHPAFTDLDGDLDLDLAVGERDGIVNYYENTGDATTPIFAPTALFAGLSVGLRSTPTFADLDGNGTLELIIGDQNGFVHVFENTPGVAPSIAVNVIAENDRPQLTDLGPSVTFAENTVNAAPQVLDASVTFTDPEGNFDGGILRVLGLLAEDIVSVRNQGTGAGQIGFLAGTVSFGSMAIGTASGGTGGTLTVVLNASATTAAVDALIENLTYQDTSDTPALSRTLTIEVLDSDGATSKVDFTELAGVANPFNGLLGGTFRETSVPVMADLDGDGDLDAVVGTRNTVQYFENTGTTLAPVLVERTGAANPFSLVNFSAFFGSASPTLVDLDNDGDLDAVVGESRSGRLHLYENIGTALAPVFTEITFTGTGIDLGRAEDPAAADLDGDGDLDLLVGERFGSFRYFVNVGTAAAPSYVEQSGLANPMNGVSVGGRATSAFADLNGDGLTDVVVGNRDGILRTFYNTGTTASPAFTEQTGTANLFDGVDVIDGATPTFGDLDGDGDLDAVVGGFMRSDPDGTGTLHYFLNTGTATAPVYAEQSGATNPFDGNVGVRNPVLADVDGDGDLDAVAGGSRSGPVRYFENTGTTIAPTYVEQTGAANPFAGIIERDARFALTDFDGDGDLDAIVGNDNGAIVYYTNVGTATAPVFTVYPFGGEDLGRDVRPTFADLDNDGDADLVVGVQGGTLRYFENVGTATDFAFAERIGSANPFDGISVGNTSHPAFTDLDGDGDLDLAIGERDGNVNYFENAGTAAAPDFVFGNLNNLDNLAVGAAKDPAVADLDGDGDLDVLVGNNGGNFQFFLNVGTAANPDYVEQFGAANPMDGVNVGRRSTSVLADINGDGLIDAIVGERFGTLRTYLNTGTALVPVFTEQTGAANLFDGVDLVDGSTPALGDVDGDGDLDAVIGGFTARSPETGTLHYFLNTGTTTAPVFVEQSAAANPFSGIVGVRNPVLADVDGDGDLDAIAGGPRDGTIHYYENTGTTTAPTFVERTGTANPFAGIIERDARFALADFDGDGDLDAVFGDRDNQDASYFENIGSATTPVFASGHLGPFFGIDVGQRSTPTFADLDGDGRLELIVGEQNGLVHVFDNRVGESQIVVNVTPEADINLIFGTPGPDKLTGTPGVDVIDAGKGNDTVNGGDGNDVFIARPGDGNDTYNGGAGSDTLDLSLLTAAVRVRLGMPVSGSNGRAEGTQVVDDTLISIENVISGSGNDTLHGNDFANYIDGGAGNDKISGFGGADELVGGSGNDLIDGGTGADMMAGGLGNDTYTVDNIGDTVTETTAGASGGTDLVKSSVTFTLGDNVENLTLTGTAAINGTGNSGANTILGNSGANTLDGGTDLLPTTIDQLKGGVGGDTYVVRDANDKVTEVAGQGTDKVQSFVTYTLLANVENLELQGAAVLDGTGNTLANKIMGNDGANTLNGMAGKDTLTGGADADVFQFNTKLSATSNLDTITDFGNGADMIQLDNAIFTKLGAAGPLDPLFFKSGAGAVAGDNNDYIVYDTATGILSYDSNGSAAGGSIKFAILTGAPALTASVFEVV